MGQNLYRIRAVKEEWVQLDQGLFDRLFDSLPEWIA